MSEPDINKKISIAIIGAGLIGRKRAQNLPEGCMVKIICDVDEERGKQFAADFNCEFVKDWKKVVKRNDIEAIMVATTHDWLTPIGVAAIKNNKHVLIEKPGARNLKEFEKLIFAHQQNPVSISFGYNHRYHPAIIKAKELIGGGKFGKVLFIRARYGHGARLGYEKEWRFDRKISGGGELIDQGPHLIDLTNYLCGPMDEVKGFIGTMFWKTKEEDAAFWVMKNKSGQMAELSVSCVEWKNIFSFEIMLTTAKIQIDGLGRSYGKEHLTLYKMKPEMGPPEVEEFEFPEEDNSWKIENKIFIDKIKNKDYSDKAILDAKYVFEVVGKLYKLKNK